MALDCPATAAQLVAAFFLAGAGDPERPLTESGRSRAKFWSETFDSTQKHYAREQDKAFIAQ